MNGFSSSGIAIERVPLAETGWNKSAAEMVFAGPEAFLRIGLSVSFPPGRTVPFVCLAGGGQDIQRRLAQEHVLRKNRNRRVGALEKRRQGPDWLMGRLLPFLRE